MGYELHITRRVNWIDDGADISLAEWQAYLDGAPDMRDDGYAKVVTACGNRVGIEAPGLAVWTGHSSQTQDGNQAWFLYADGQITVKNPDPEIRRKMFVIAQHFGASVQGDDGEHYNRSGDVDEQGRGKLPLRSAPWWRFWR